MSADIADISVIAELDEVFATADVENDPATSPAVKKTASKPMRLRRSIF